MPPPDLLGPATPSPLFPDACPALRLCVLGSGSGGNCSVAQAGDHVILLDAGLGPRIVARHLDALGLHPGQVRGVCVTHLDQDHFRPTWFRALARWRVPLFVHDQHADGLRQMPGCDLLFGAGLVRRFVGAFEPVPGFAATPVHLPHDRKGTIGYRFDTPGRRLGYATDLGQVPAELIELFADVHVLAIESNYDVGMQRRSGRPEHLKRRIMGGRGHLSNEQSLDAVRHIARRSSPENPRRVVLLHRSRQCNTEQLVRMTFEGDPAIGPRIVLSEQGRRTAWISADAGPMHALGARPVASGPASRAVPAAAQLTLW